MKNGVFWDVMPCGSCKNRRFEGTWCLHHQGDKNHRLLVTANVVPSSHGVTSQETPFFKYFCIPHQVSWDVSTSSARPVYSPLLPVSGFQISFSDVKLLLNILYGTQT
jgi:hypothetical protein